MVLKELYYGYFDWCEYPMELVPFYPNLKYRIHILCGVFSLLIHLVWTEMGYPRRIKLIFNASFVHQICILFMKKIA